MVTRLIVDIKDPLLDFLVNFLSSVDEGLSKKMQQCLVQQKLTRNALTTHLFFSNLEENLKGIRVIIWIEFSFLCSKWTIELRGGDFIG